MSALGTQNEAVALAFGKVTHGLANSERNRPLALSENPVETMSMSVDLEEHTLLTKEQAAARLQISQRTLWTWGAQGRLEVVHLTPRTLRYTEQSIRALMTPAAQAQKDRAGFNQPNGGTNHEDQ